MQAVPVLEGGDAGRRSRGTVSDGDAEVRVLAVGATPTSSAPTAYNPTTFTLTVSTPTPVPPPPTPLPLPPELLSHPITPT